MSSTDNKKRISEWAKENKVSAEVVSRLLRNKGVEVRSFLSVVAVTDLENIRAAAVEEQIKLDKKIQARKAGQHSSSPSSAESSGTPVKNSSKERTTKVKVSGGKKVKVTLRRSARPPEEKKEIERPRTPVSTPVVAKSKQETEAKKPNFVKENAPVAPQKAPSNQNPSEKKPSPVPENSVAVGKNKPVENKKPESKQQQPASSEKKSSPAAKPVPEVPKTAPFKAKIEKPNPELLARIQKSQQQQQQRRSNRGGNQGYTGSFGRAPGRGGQGQQNQRGGHNNRGEFGNNSMQEAMAGAGFERRGPQGGGAGRGPGQQGGQGGGHHSMPNQGGGAGTMPSAGGGGGGGRAGGRNKGGKGKKGRNTRVEKETLKEQMNAVRQNVNRVMASLSKNPVKKTYRKEVAEALESTEKRILKTSDFITVGELAGLMEQMPAKVIAKCMEMGMMVTINARLDFETIQVLADEFGFEAQLMEEYEEEHLGLAQEENPEDMVPRSPIVTVMGHVDHGKTSLLDYIRKENVVAGESGGITQHIGAYEVVTPSGRVTFLDTPGHEAFTAMRARGSQVTDVIVLVVAADSMVMPQTVEVIELVKSAKVPLVVAITKSDLPTANPDKIRTQLAERGIEVEQWGGQTSCVEVSSHTGDGISKLLEVLALETEVLELKANPDSHARGTVIESKLDPGKGAMATILVQNGTLRVGDIFVCGNFSGRVRAMFDERGNSRQEAGPSVPCQLLGFDGTPQAGDELVSFPDEKTARSIASNRRMAARERELRFRKHMSLEQVYDRVQSGEFSELNLIVKADVDGSAEAIAASLEKVTNSEVKINIIRKAVGAVNDSDILLASTADAVIIAFHLMPSLAIREMAEKEGVEIRTYRIIYEIIEEIQGVVEGMLKPTIKEEMVGEAEIREVFKIPKIGIIAGCMVKEGLVDRESQVRVYRDGVELGLTRVQSLKRHKDDAASVKQGMECGIGLKGYENIREGDSLIFFKQVEVQRTLADLERETEDKASGKKS